jgi:predicted metallopeptidase
MRKLKWARKSTKSSKKVDWQLAPDIKSRALKLVTDLSMDWILFERIFFYRSMDSKARAYARTWGLPRLWQRSLEVEPAYIIEVLSEHFDKLDQVHQDKVILHELTHIPHNFSGALVAHTRHKKGSFHDKLDRIVEEYFKSKNF